MSEPFVSFELKRPVLLLKMLSNGALSAVDADTTLYFIHPQTFKIIGGCWAEIPQERPWGNHVDVGLYAQVFAAVIPHSNKAALYAVKKKKILHEIGRHQGQVESVAIDPKTRYVITGGEDGKLFAWDIKTAVAVFTLPPHTDHVTAIAFSEDARFVATGSYDKQIHIVALEGTKRPRKLHGHSSAVVKLAFVSENMLLSAGKGGEVIVWDLQRGKIAKRLDAIDDEITALTLCDAKRYLFVGTKEGVIRLYDLHGNKILTANYLKMNCAVTALAYMGEGHRLAVGTSEGSVGIYALRGDETALNRLADTCRYAEFYAAAEANAMLCSSQLYMDVEKRWEAAVNEARGLLESGDVAGAKAVLYDFSDVRCKKPLIRELLRNSDAFVLFKAHVEAGRYALAYADAARYPQFKTTPPYEKMQEQWRKALVRARGLMGRKNGEEEIRKVFSPYRGISEKTPTIQELLYEARHFLYFKELIAKGDWKKVFELVRQHPFLKETREFFSLVNYGDKLFIQASKAYEQGDLTMTEELCVILLDFPDFKADVREMLDDLRRKG